MARQTIIDLTLTDDSNDDGGNSRGGGSGGGDIPVIPTSYKAKTSHPSSRTRTYSLTPAINGIAGLNGDGGGHHNHHNYHHHHHNEGETRPNKRRKVNDASATTPSGGKEATAGIDRQSLMRCLERQVIPHLDKALDRLPQNVYDARKLGKKIIGQVADRDLEYQFRRGEGRLADDVEARVATRIERLVNESIADPQYGLPSTSSPAPAQTQPAFTTAATRTLLNQSSAAAAVPIPSIENGRLERAGDEQYGEGLDLLVKTEDDDDDDYDKLREAPPPPPLVPEKPPPPQARAKKRVMQLGGQWNKQAKSESSSTALTVTGKGKGKEKGNGKETDVGVGKGNLWFGLSSRPYIRFPDRQLIIAGISSSSSSTKSLARLGPDRPSVIHVDFTEDEIKYLRFLARTCYGQDPTRPRGYLRDLRHLLKKDSDRTLRRRILRLVQEGYVNLQTPPPPALLIRSVDDVANYLSDLVPNRTHSQPKVLSLERRRDDCDWRRDVVPSVLLAREVGGNRPLHKRVYTNFTVALKTNREDALQPRVEWTGCAGDITTISWLSNTHFVCGTTTHSDSHNQQYNKPGNLLLGSTAAKTLRAYPDHRIVRPIVERGDNALDSMRESQDPWLFTSVVSSDYEPTNDLAFTSSFDKTVKVWKLGGDGMTLVGTWYHDGRVNFVVASAHPLGMVATAADVPTDAVRVYHVQSQTDDISSSRFDSYSCTRVHDESDTPSDKWAYFPATIRWGLAPETRHLLLIGYSPRSLSDEEDGIPEDKRQTGELCLWDTITRTQVKVNSAATRNVFEVVWHPWKATFAAATTASGLEIEGNKGNINTQIRIFKLSEGGAYTAIKTLDCSAVDINEISIRPNSWNYSYVTASCTDGNVYVWDTSQDDLPMCVLRHGEPVEELLGEREQEDVGVKFTAWGTTADRLYTGSSDGVVKVWNVRHGNAVLVKNLVEASGPIICGAFSPDFTKLAVGDGTGRVYLMTLDEEEEKDEAAAAATSTTVSSGALNSSAFLKLGGKQIRRPRPIIPHPEVPPPGDDNSAALATAAAETATSELLYPGQERAREYLRNGELVLHPDLGIGAVQGPNYAQTGLFRAEAHAGGDPSQPLVAAFEVQQQRPGYTAAPRQLQRRQQSVFDISGSVVNLEGNGKRLTNAAAAWASAAAAALLYRYHEKAWWRNLHRENISLDQEVTDFLPAATRMQLVLNGADPDMLDNYATADYGFSYEED